jgi:hypothetical protein
MSPNLRPEERHIFVVEVTLTWLGRLAAVVTIVTTLTKCGRRSGTGFCAHSLLLYAATDTRSHRTGHPILHLVPGARLGRPLKHVTLQMPRWATNLNAQLTYAQTGARGGATDERTSGAPKSPQGITC